MKLAWSLAFGCIAIYLAAMAMLEIPVPEFTKLMLLAALYMWRARRELEE